MRYLHWAVRGALDPTGARRLRAVAELARAVQRPVTTGRWIAVTGVWEGAGQDVVAALMAMAFAHLRADRVLLIEAAPTRPAPLVRASTVAGVPPVPAAGQLSLLRSPGQAQVAAVRRYFAVTVVCCGDRPGPHLLRSVLLGAHAHVLVAPDHDTGARVALGALDWMAANRWAGMVSRTVVALTTTAGAAAPDPAVARALARRVPVVPLRYDRGLTEAVTGSDVITPAHLSPATCTTAFHLAAEALRRALPADQGLVGVDWRSTHPNKSLIGERGEA